MYPPTHSPPAGISKDSEPFFQPSHRPRESSPDKCTGPDTHTALQWSAGKPKTDKTGQGKTASERTGLDTHALQHKSAGKLKSDSDHHHQGAPVQTLLKSLSRPVSLHLTDTKVIVYLQTLTMLVPSFSLLATCSPTDLVPTDQAHLCLLVRNRLLFNILIDGTAFQV